jgi:PIN domain nuclease of toxin-antitoxin system
VRLLLDTHALIWWFLDAPQLSAAAYAAIEDEDNEKFVSAASAWEIATKFRLGRLPGAGPLAVDLPGAIAKQGFLPLDITVLHGQRAGALRGTHRDPFDRILMAQAIAERMGLVSNETAFDAYGVHRLW